MLLAFSAILPFRDICLLRKCTFCRRSEAALSEEVEEEAHRKQVEHNIAEEVLLVLESRAEE